MSIKIALAGNPNSGKTTLFNALTGSNQFVGNWPGVTVEKKEGKLKGRKEVVITDLPGIYSLSPYTLEEVVARNYLIDERPDAILNIIDGTNLERNLFLTTQLTEMGIPVVVAVNMMDVVNKSGDKIDTARLSKELGCRVVEISALKGHGVMAAADAAVQAAGGTRTVPQHSFSGGVEHTLAHIEEHVLHGKPQEQQRFFAIKLFERDAKIIEKLGITPEQVAHIEDDIKRREEELADDSESIITAERYTYIDSIIKDCVKVKNKGRLSASDKIDKVVTNRWLALPIFAAIMFIVYFVSVTTVGAFVTDWTNDGLFGDGFFIGSSGNYEEVAGEFDSAQTKIEAYIAAAEEAGIDTAALTETLEAEEPDEGIISAFVQEASDADITTDAEISDDETGEVVETLPVTAAEFEAALTVEESDPADYGTWVPGIPVLVESGLTAINCVDWLQGLILDGIVAGVGAVLGFVPQMLILFLFLAFLERCGYMARIAFILDRVFRRFGLSGKSFIPILIGTGCGVPGIMAARTIENDRDRKMTIMTTTFIPCGAKLPIIALFAGAIFNGAAWVATASYFIGLAAIICSGVILKKTKLFSGDVAPFVMELPAYHWPTPGGVLRSMWERGWSFIKKAGTIILLATIGVWFLSFFGWVDGSFQMLGEENMDSSILAHIGNGIAFLFTPLGWGHWRAAVATVTGLIAKENVVGTFGILYGSGSQFWNTLADPAADGFSALAGFSFLVFNLLCAPCFAAMGAIKREMNSAKWFWIAIGYQCLLAYVVALCIYQLGMLFSGSFGIFTVAALLLVAGFLFLMFRPAKKNRLASSVLHNKS
ncbi:MAG: ferrous iron transporter B [Oscillospiraceae bacterium]|jgi:ferrous iron transport protein B|nr:ferrous iron transporter B [Oscillospiraceae bacterium]